MPLTKKLQAPPAAADRTPLLESSAARSDGAAADVPPSAISISSVAQSPVPSRASSHALRSPPTVASSCCAVPRHLRCDRLTYLRLVNWLHDVLEGDHGYDPKTPVSRRAGRARLLPCCCCAGLCAALLVLFLLFGGTATAVSFAGMVGTSIESLRSTLDSMGGFGTWLSELPSTLSSLDIYTWLWSGASGATNTSSVEPSVESCPDGLLVAGPLPTPASSAGTLCMLLWLFYGVSIGADLFMEAIESITSEEVLTYVPMPGGQKRPLTVSVWNATIANLTLMALGSSAPEILLSVIEICGNGFYAGELGPSTIVGSAAFNLMVISAVCVTAIPDGEGRYVKNELVFGITSTFSILAYVWLGVILLFVSPNVIDVWEGVLTLAFFPLLVYMSYLADTGQMTRHRLSSCVDGWLHCCGGSHVPPLRSLSRSLSHSMSRTLLSASDAPAQHNGVLEVVGGGGMQAAQRHSAAYYRMTALRAAIGGANSQQREELKHEREAREIAERVRKSLEAGYRKSTFTSKVRKIQTVDVAAAQIELGASHFTAKHTDGTAEVVVFRSGSLTATDTVNFVVLVSDGAAAAASAPAGNADHPVVAEGTVKFEPTQQRATLRIQLDHELVRPVAEGGHAERGQLVVQLREPSRGASIGKVDHCAVRVVGNDASGVLCIASLVHTLESTGHADLVIEREEGSHGVVGCTVNTRDGRAVAPNDYEEVKERVLEFGHGEVRKVLQVAIHNDDSFEGDEDFYVVLSDAYGGATFAEECDGGPERAVVKVVIQCDDVHRATGLDACLVRFGLNYDLLEQVGLDWWHQFEDAVAFEGQVLFFALAMPWRLAFAFAPPPRLFGGWACFLVALGMIGGITALIGDYASNLGCCFGISKSVTAITFVALGTSLPDTFASRTAATSEPHADNSLGNITGSNSVNVFLGLGLPWAVAAIYWALAGSAHEGAWRARYEGEPWYDASFAAAPPVFAVPAGALGYSVSVFCGCALVTLLTLKLRRVCLGCELGGPARWTTATAVLFLGLWLVYIVLSILGES